MKLKNILIAVHDIERAKTFYKKMFGLDPVLEQEGNVILTEGLVLQDADVWQKSLGRGILSQNNAFELYFEESNMEAFAKRLEEYEDEIQYVDGLTELSWGQKMVRFYDPDGNLIEVRSPAAGGK
ncbi:VOC family protein [Mediterraneibacter glycyrrhizinilyticus]|uniref:VOC family protein n=1 Tax=Mediterraneibacter glycyrrhizinilyticus TaxID=342942 RepID=UPI00195F2855|nr:VOC family protein [Mediterraneibacter glycyrrhizinilyticus]MBM6749889.1 VOC family protein [Mediterraneibacter glycyrrhizinilyticus]